MDAASPTDAWAVGEEAGDHPAIIEHWDGTSWSLVPNPDPNPSSSLSDVEVIAADDVWAVGSTTPEAGPVEPLALHWDGTSWQVSDALPGNAFAAVGGAAPDDIWAGFGGGQHWNGSEWERDASAARLGDIEAIATDDVWATGTALIGGHLRSVFAHWDGGSWSETRPFHFDGLRALAAVSANDVWAVGSRESNHGHVTVTAHWDGEAWSLVSSPNYGTYNVITSAAAKATNDVWAFGARTGHALAMHWDGKAWAIVRPAPVRGGETLSDVASIPGGGWWTIGHTDDGELIERHC